MTGNIPITKSDLELNGVKEKWAHPFVYPYVYPIENKNILYPM